MFNKSNHVCRLNNYDTEERFSSLRNGYMVEFTTDEYHSYYKDQKHIKVLHEGDNKVILQQQEETKSDWEDLFK